MVKIIADSSADIRAVEGVCFQSVPMTIRAGGRDFVDNEQLDTAAMLDFLASHNGPSGTACPGPEPLRARTRSSSCASRAAYPARGRPRWRRESCICKPIPT